MYTRTCTRMHAHIHKLIHICMYLHKHTRTHGYMRLPRACWNVMHMRVLVHYTCSSYTWHTAHAPHITYTQRHTLQATHHTHMYIYMTSSYFAPPHSPYKRIFTHITHTRTHAHTHKTRLYPNAFTFWCTMYHVLYTNAHMHTRVFAHTHTHTHTHAHTHTCPHTHTHTKTCVDAHTRAYMHTHIHMHTLTCMHARTHTHTHARTHTHTHAHTHMHAYMHTHIHMHTCSAPTMHSGL